MTKVKEVYRCPLCGNIVEVVHAAGGTLSCCGQPMVLLVENTTDAALEKHVPVIEKIDGGYRVSVGSVAHPMLPEHFIEWIELVTPTCVLRRYLKPGEQPVAEFKTDATEVFAREYCNLHGLWKSAE
jgi:superoxide reductase